MTHSSKHCHVCSVIPCFRSSAAVARHLHLRHPDRSDFPVLFVGRVADPVGSASMAELVLQEIDLLLYNGLKVNFNRTNGHCV